MLISRRLTGPLCATWQDTVFHRQRPKSGPTLACRVRHVLRIELDFGVEIPPAAEPRAHKFCRVTGCGRCNQFPIGSGGITHEGDRIIGIELQGGGIRVVAIKFPWVPSKPALTRIGSINSGGGE